MQYKSALDPLFQANSYPNDFFSLDKVFGDKPIIIYGAGESSIWFFEIVTQIFGYHATLVLDRKFREEGVHEGVRARSPVDFYPSETEQTLAVIVICSGQVNQEQEIRKNLEELGFQNIISLRDIYEIHNPFSQPVSLQEQGFDFYKKHKQQIYSAYELFEDDMSKEVYQCFLQTHMQRKPVLIPDRPRDEQYFPSDITLNKGYEKFISCGAYDGDSVRLLNRLHGKVDEIVCVEAEPAIYARLTDYLNRHSLLIANNITALPCAAYSHEAIMNFTSSTGLGSRLSKAGECLVQTAALDHLLPTFSPSFISMDIEGAELEALKGAEKMIMQHKPDLGICVYHSAEHLWKIPLYLDSLNLGYRFYLRNYTSFTIETVVYATV
jgi:FkbM family methyltransferase